MRRRRRDGLASRARQSLHRTLIACSGFRYNSAVRTSLRFILISDDVRTEDNGKLIVIGLHGSEIQVPHLPVAIPLAFTAGIHLEGQGAFNLSGTLRHSNSGEELLSFWAKGETQKSGAGYVPFKFATVHFREAGIYEVSLAVEGQEEWMTEPFEIKAK